jgi:hypothetical protein
MAHFSRTFFGNFFQELLCRWPVFSAARMFFKRRSELFCVATFWIGQLGEKNDTKNRTRKLPTCIHMYVGATSIFLPTFRQLLPPMYIMLSLYKTTYVHELMVLFSCR